jgi:hypothetical protein
MVIWFMESMSAATCLLLLVQRPYVGRYIRGFTYVWSTAMHGTVNTVQTNSQPTAQYSYYFFCFCFRFQVVINPPLTFEIGRKE